MEGVSRFTDTEGSGTCQRRWDTGGSDGCGGQCRLLGWVDPCCLGDPGGGGWLSESFGAGGVGSVEDGLASGADGGVEAVVDAGGGEETDAGAAAGGVVVWAEKAAETGRGVHVGEASGGREGELTQLTT